MTARPYRPLPLGLGLVIAVASAFVALAFSGGHDAAAHNDASHAAISQKELALRQDMRQLWEDHIAWTRLAVIGLTTAAPDTKVTVARLLRNQTDIGNAIKPFYGKAAGAKLTALLREHILIAADLVAAAQKGDAEAVASEQARWQANGDQIAAFLAAANPGSWKLPAMKAMMRDHLRLTTNEVVARLQHKWAADVRTYDLIHLQILGMADMLSDGLVAQFPGRFR